jgi:hypothetical protein
MPQIVQSKNLKSGTVIGSNVKVRITAMKRLRPAEPIVDGKRKPRPRELWQVEADGLSSIEVMVDVPLPTARLKDAKVRDARIRELVTAQAMAHFAKDLAVHAA